MTIVVLGGYGNVGSHVVNRLREAGEHVLTAGRDARRADLVLDARSPSGIDASLDGVDVVVNTAGIEDPALARQITRAGAAFVDITATTGYVEALERSQLFAPVLLSVGLAPGLTNLLAAELHREAPGRPIDIALLLGAGERYGKASTAWAYRLLGQHLQEPTTGAHVRNYSRPLQFDLPGYGRRRLYRADYSDQHVLQRDLGVRVRTYFGLTSRIATASLAALTRIPGAATTAPRLHLPGDQRWLAMARSASGDVRALGGSIQSHTTAAITAIAALKVRQLPTGIHHLHQVMDLADLGQTPIATNYWHRLDLRPHLGQETIDDQ
jgi:NAD(P)-dependent dehydrogenase (short-subunit alcohol dehydrogenase family)